VALIAEPMALTIPASSEELVGPRQPGGVIDVNPRNEDPIEGNTP
jgi:hypothetical protein